MTSLKFKNLKIWLELNAVDKVAWYRPWHRGYIQACRDALYLLEKDIVILPLEEYKAIEGHYTEEEWPFP